MADDDLLSLDFTMPGALENAPAETVTPEKPALSLELVPVDAPPSVAEAPSAPPPRARLPAALEDAATMHAAGQEIEALRRLEAALKSGEDLGDCALRVWGGLFDLLQGLGRRPAFDALALAFAKRFEKSPPTWSGDVAEDHEAHASSSGRAHVSLTGMLDASIGEVLKQAMKLAQTSSLVRIDLGKLVDANNDGATLMMRALAALKKAKKDYVLGSPEHLAQLLSAKLTVGERRDEQMWLLLLALHQQAFHQEAFEDAAVNYAVTFEVSPPSWEMPQHPPEVTPEVSPEPATGFSLRGQLVGTTAADFAALEGAAAGRDQLDVDANYLVRIDAAGTGHLLDLLTRLKADGKCIRIVGLPTLVAAWMEMQGLAAVAELHPRSL